MMPRAFEGPRSIDVYPGLISHLIFINQLYNKVIARMMAPLEQNLRRSNSYQVGVIICMSLWFLRQSQWWISLQNITNHNKTVSLAKSHKVDQTQIWIWRWVCLHVQQVPTQVHPPNLLHSSSFPFHMWNRVTNVTTRTFHTTFDDDAAKGNTSSKFTPFSFHSLLQMNMNHKRHNLDNFNHPFHVQGTWASYNKVFFSVGHSYIKANFIIKVPEEEHVCFNKIWEDSMLQSWGFLNKLHGLLISSIAISLVSWMSKHISKPK